MRTWRLFLLAMAAATPATTAPAAAQPSAAAARGSAEALVDLMGIEAKLDKTFAALGSAFGGLVIAQAQTEPQGAAWVNGLIAKLPGGRDRLVQILGEEYLKEIRKTYPALKAKVAEAYRGHFTDAELQEMIRYYSSGVGAKQLAFEAELQDIMAESGREAGREAGSAAAVAAMRRAERESPGK